MDKYNNESDYNYTPEQIIQLNKLQQSRTAYEEKQRTLYKQANNSIKIGNVDLNSINPMYKWSLFIIVFCVFFVGLLYLLKSVQAKPKVSKKKKTN